jgi:hypothetical protein
MRPRIYNLGRPTKEEGEKMTTIVKYFTAATEMENFIQSYFQEYHPAGYDTRVDSIKAVPIYFDGKFKGIIKYEVTISRLDSCD